MIFTSTKFGFDISTWQDDPNIAGTVNFDKMRDSGASFVIFRASIGDQFDVDFPTFKANSRGKLPRGVYHYYWNNIDPKIQAQKCLAAIGGEPLEGRVWLDLETTTAGAFVGPTHWRTFLETIRAAGLRVGIYTGYFWWKTNAATADMTYFGQFPLWQAWYTFDPSIVLIARGWDKITIWQDTSSYPGAPAGVESPTIDHNQWNDAVDFAAEWGTLTPPPIGEPMRYTATALSDGTRLRPESNVNKTYISSHARNTKFSGDVLFIATAPTVPNQNVGDKWLQVKEINGVPFTGVGWVAITHLGASVCTLVENVPPPAPDSITIDIAVSDVKTAGDRYEVKGVKAVKVA